MVANAPLLVDSIATPLSSKPQTAEAARRLEGAHASVQGLFDTLHTARELKVIVLKIPVARLAHGEVDLLRAAVVFAGAGLDAVLKQLMNDALHDVIDKHAVARGRLTAFAAELVKQEPRLATKILTAASADIQLRTAYLENLTKGSLQGDGELKNVRDALGIDPVGAFSNAALESMRDFFAARNEIVHELDLKKPTGRGDFTRKARHMKTCRDQANSALVLSGEFIRATDALLWDPPGVTLAAVATAVWWLEVNRVGTMGPPSKAEGTTLVIEQAQALRKGSVRLVYAWLVPSREPAPMHSSGPSPFVESAPRHNRSRSRAAQILASAEFQRPPIQILTDEVSDVVAPVSAILPDRAHDGIHLTSWHSDYELLVPRNAYSRWVTHRRNVFR